MIQIRSLFSRWRGIGLAASLATLAVLGVRYLGVLQSLEWAAYDQFVRWRSSAQLPPDDRIKIVTIDEPDLSAGGQALISDRALAQVLRALAAQDPYVIGLDLYRDLPVPPGHQDLVAALREIPNVVGIQKVGHPSIVPQPVLKELERSTASDFVVDGDNQVRRGFLFLMGNQGETIDAFGPRLALTFLEAQNIYFEKLSEDYWRLGAATFKRFGGFDGGYVRAHTGAYQLLINYRGSGQQFEYIPFRDVIAGQFPPNWARNRIVLIGTTAESLNDVFPAPVSGIGLFQSPNRLSGVEIHAHIIAQILDAAQGTRPLIQPIAEPLEILWTLAWSALGAIVVWPGRIRESLPLFRMGSPKWQLLGQLGIMLGLLGVLMGSSYMLFVEAIWLPIVPPALGFITAGGAIALYNANQVNQLRLKNEILDRLANVDGLTQVANRRSFDLYLQDASAQAQKQEQSIALILCDVDYFKRYNDTCGHQAGDDCLRQVAQALSSSVKQPGCLVARYGGEEFAIILPGLEQAQVEAIAVTIQQTLVHLALPHPTSAVSPQITLSLGIAIAARPQPSFDPAQLIRWADQALYQAKEDGRNRYCTVWVD
ncbi:MAG: CHASE2 domain-containing protein [Spirulina sp. SIO3F2]|nr:CHASE2 domain-containing protein [Spirulina sp. SIO3F2]